MQTAVPLKDSGCGSLEGRKQYYKAVNQFAGVRVKPCGTRVFLFFAGRDAIMLSGNESGQCRQATKGVR